MQETPALLLAVAVLGTWRLAHLVAHEDGPLDLVIHLRRRAGVGWLGALMDCPYCLSLWFALPAAAWLAHHWQWDALAALWLWLAVSGGACAIEKLTAAPEREPQ